MRQKGQEEFQIMKAMDSVSCASLTRDFRDCAHRYEKNIRTLKNLQQRKVEVASKYLAQYYQNQIQREITFVETILDLVESNFGNHARMEVFNAYVSEKITMEQMAELQSVSVKTISRHCSAYLHRAIELYIQSNDLQSSDPDQ